MPQGAQAHDDKRPGVDLGHFVGTVRITRADGKVEDVGIEIPITPAMLELASPQQPNEAR